MTEKIKELVFSFLNMVNMHASEVKSGVWQAVVPRDEKSFFNSFDILKFTFDREIAELHRDVELICEGSFLLRRITERLEQIPKASRLFAVQEPELPPPSAGLSVVSKNSYYRNKVIFNFKVQFNCDKQREKLISIAADTADGSLTLQDGLQSIDLNKYSTTPKEGVEIENSDVEVLRLYLEACKKLEEYIQKDIKQLKEWGAEKCAESIKSFDAYLDEQKQELLKKRESVSFHLYFFQKEEEIDKLIDNLESERKQKMQELREKFSLRVNISLVNAVVLCVPTIGSLKLKNRKKDAESFGLTPRRPRKRVDNMSI